MIGRSQGVENEKVHRAGLNSDEIKLTDKQEAEIRTALKRSSLDHHADHYGMTEFIIQIQQNGYTQPQQMAQLISDNGLSTPMHTALLKISLVMTTAKAAMSAPAVQVAPARPAVSAPTIKAPGQH